MKSQKSNRATSSVQRVVRAPYDCHSGDCTIYRALLNGRPYDGICTCGYGWQLVRKGDHSQMLSEERQRPNVKAEP